ncbi:hypothetical protein V1525DRAFT_425668 [Lipomyces kononenkoae]|uniref:Uncharacterized protein n=1 Tax=Lipomyces kononenkoae TaxID=34357 RepID=A0ACC3T2V0_LIPKO
MIKADETSPSGYLLAGKICQAMKNDCEAESIYATKMQKVCETQKSRTRSGAGVRDPLRRLPTEVVLLIFGYVPFRQVVQLQRVCNSWKGLIESSPSLWRSLDFRTCKKESVDPQALKSCMSKCKGSAKKVYLSNLTPLCSALCLAIILDHNLPLDIREPISPDVRSNPWERYIQYSHNKEEAPIQLTYLYLDQSVGLFFNNWSTLGAVTWARLSQLTVFRAHAKIFPDIVQVLCQGCLPKLKILDCYYDPKESGRCRSIYNVSISRPGSPDYKTLPELQVFNIGGIPADSAGKHGSGNGKGVSVYVDHRDLDNFLSMLPNLKMFSCVDVHASSRGPDGPYFERTDFRRNAALEELVIIGSWLERMPILPPSCRKLIMSGTSMTPRTVLHGGSEMRYDSSYVGEDTTVFVDEYSSIKHLDLSRCEMLIDSKLIATLARCDASRLTRLELANCPGLFFSTPIYGAALMAHIVESCPSLRKLNVSENISVDDFVLLEISKLRYLEYLDISCTAVHNLGVLLLLKGLFIQLSGHQDYLCDDSALRAMIEENRALLLAGDPAAHPMSFNTLIANGCQGISNDMCWWIEDIGICIECKLGKEGNGKKRKREDV